MIRYNIPKNLVGRTVYTRGRRFVLNEALSQEDRAFLFNEVDYPLEKVEQPKEPKEQVNEPKKQTAPPIETKPKEAAESGSRNAQ